MMATNNELSAKLDAALAELKFVGCLLRRQDDRIDGIHKLALRILEQESHIMATQADLVVQLTAIKDNLVKVGGETTTLLAKIDELQALIANAPVSPELQAAVDAVAAQAKVVDDLVADAPPAP